MEKITEEILEQIRQLFEAYRSKLESSYLGSPGDFSVNIGVKLSPGEKSATATMVETSISFVCERIKDKTKNEVDDRQMKLGEA
jgi:hypothetical protein